MSKRARMGTLAQMLVDPAERTESSQNPGIPKPGNKKNGKRVFGKLASRRIVPKTDTSAPPMDINRPYGERGNFEKVTVTLPSGIRLLLLEESVRRKKDHSPEWPIAAIVREAIAAYLLPKQ